MQLCDDLAELPGKRHRLHLVQHRRLVRECGRVVCFSRSGHCLDIATATLRNSFKATVPDPTDGGCTPAPETDTAAVSVPRRLCELGTGGCIGDVCGAPFDECVEAAGPCPVGYATIHTVGTSIDVACPTCSCTLSAGSCTGSLQLYTRRRAVERA